MYIKFKVLVHIHKIDEALELLSMLIRMLVAPNPLLLLQRAKLLLRENKVCEAASDLQTALSQYPSYSYYLKCEKLIDRIVKSKQWVPKRCTKLALMGSSTTSFLAPVLKAVCFQSGIQIEIYEGNYGNYQQEILDSGSGLYKFAPEIVTVLINHRDMAAEPKINPKTIEATNRQIRSLWSYLQQRNPCHIVQVGFDVPVDGAWGYLENALPDGRVRAMIELNLSLSSGLPSGVSFLDINEVAKKIGAPFYSDSEWYTAKQYPATFALPELSAALTAQYRAVLGLSAKVLVLDLDNTLWGGIIGEDGLNGIVLGSPSPDGEAFVELQQYIKQLQTKGVLLAVCSKNNNNDAEIPFRQHEEMVLKLDDFVLFYANWEDKATNIQKMANTLSLGLDSFVFLDDNPFERNWVRSKLPQVIVPECGNLPCQMLQALRQGKFFESIVVTPEDSARHENYKTEIARQHLEEKSASLEDFLHGLKMRAENGPIDAGTLTRVTQLINKTNQFNLTTRRYSEERVNFMAKSPKWWTRWFRLKDRFGDYGLIGVILVENKGANWQIDSWLMSCRVLGRNMEEYMFGELLRAAQMAGVETIIGDYIPTTKNDMVSTLFLRLGFIQNENDARFYYHVRQSQRIVCKCINSNSINGI